MVLNKREMYWNQIKENNNASSTEDLFGFVSQPEAQCPKVDSIIKEIVSVQKESHIHHNDDLEDLTSKLESINSDTYYLDSDVEELRTAIIGIRDWGQQWKDLAKRLIQDNKLDIDEI